jgi:hypothetical protein
MNPMKPLAAFIAVSVHLHLLPVALAVVVGVCGLMLVESAIHPERSTGE